MLQHRGKVLVDNQGSLSSENNVDVCLLGCLATVDIGCIHFPLHTTSETITQKSSFLGQFLLDFDKRPLDPELLTLSFFLHS